MTDTKALKTALEALESCNTWHITDGSRQWYDERLVDKAITALREAPAEQPPQPQQEQPVAWVCYGSSDSEMHDIDFEQKDVDALPVGTMLYTAPPQRKPLTDEQLLKVIKTIDRDEQFIQQALRHLARAIEAAHNIKE